MVTIPLSAVITMQIAKRSQPQFVEQWRSTGTLNAHIEEMFTGHALVKVFGRQRAAQETFDVENESLYQASFKAQFISGLIMPAMTFVSNLNYVVIAVVGGLRVASGAISIGDVQAFIQYSRQFTQPITQVASMMNLLQSGVASAERVFELLDEDEQSPEPDEPARVEKVAGRVAFEDVSFRYKEDTPLIDGLSIVAEPGQTVAIVGPTGAGKTTLVNLIMRFYEVDAGRITLDGVDTRAMDREDLRSRIGMVLQDTWLFGGTIAANIAYGKVESTQEEVEAAARTAFVDRFVHHLPDGYDTVIDEEGSNVSRRPEAAHHDRAGVPGRPGHPHPGRGDQLGGHPHRDAGPGGDERAARGADLVRHRAPAVHHPRRGRHPRHGARADRRAGLARGPAGRGRRVRTAVPVAVRGGRRADRVTGARLRGRRLPRGAVRRRPLPHPASGLRLPALLHTVAQEDHRQHEGRQGRDQPDDQGAEHPGAHPTDRQAVRHERGDQQGDERRDQPDAPDEGVGVLAGELEDQWRQDPLGHDEHGERDDEAGDRHGEVGEEERGHPDAQGGRTKEDRGTDQEDHHSSRVSL